MSDIRRDLNLIISNIEMHNAYHALLTSAAFVVATFQCIIPHQFAVESALVGQRTRAEGVDDIAGDT